MKRRALLGGAGAAGVAGLATMAYRTAPGFWKQFHEDLNRPVLPSPERPNPKSWPDRGLYAAWLGHSTVLLKIDGATVLTDPVFSRRIGINLGPLTLGIKRLVSPALKLRELPRVDLVVLSHAHMDHFDIPSLRALEDRKLTVITAPRTSDLLRPGRYRRVTELKWGERTRCGPVEIQAFQVNHWGARMRTDTFRGYNGYVIRAGRYQILFGGDTAATALFRQMRNGRAYDLAIMPVGAYNPWIHYHCTPEQAWQMAHDARFEFFLPVHHQTFHLSREPRCEPIERVLAAAGPHPDRVVASRIGQQWRLA